MATTEAVTAISIVAGADLSTTGQFRFINVNGSGEAVLAADGADAVGVLLNAPPQGQPAEVAIAGRVKVVASAAVTVGDEVASAASGASAAATSGDYIMGRALTAAGAADEVHEVVLLKNGTMA